MSYDLELYDPVTGKTLEFDEPHHIMGGTYAVGGTREARLNITYNYSPRYKPWGEKGVRSIYGMTGAESLALLQIGIDALDGDKDPDYWQPTEGNAKAALLQLKALAQMRPDGVWRGD